MTTQIDDIQVLTALRAKQQQMWSSGDYSKIAAITVGVNETLVSQAEIGPGERVLHIATGPATPPSPRRGSAPT